MFTKMRMIVGGVLVVMSGSSAFGCAGIGAQASDCVYYYGPANQSPYRFSGQTPAATASPATAEPERRAATERRSTSRRTTSPAYGMSREGPPQNPR